MNETQPTWFSRWNSSGSCCFCGVTLGHYDTKMVHQNSEVIACRDHFSQDAYWGVFTADDPPGFLCWTDG